MIANRSSSDQSNMQAKIVFLGDAGVGKSSILVRLDKNTFYEEYVMTVGGVYLKHVITLKNKLQFTLHIWDTGGEERYRAIVPIYYRDASAAVLVYDVSNIKSFKSLQYWLNELDSKEKADGMILALAGNKSDLPENQKQVTLSTAKTFGEGHKLILAETSARTGEGILALFQKIGEEIYKKKNKK